MSKLDAYAILLKICIEHFGDDIDPEGVGRKLEDGSLLLGRATRIEDIVQGDDIIPDELAEAIAEETGVEMEPEETLEHATLAELAETIERRASTPRPDEV